VDDGKLMNNLLKRILKKDKYFRVEFSGLDNNKVLCWLCYKDKAVITVTGSGATHEAALIDAASKTSLIDSAACVMCGSTTQATTRGIPSYLICRCGHKWERK